MALDVLQSTEIIQAMETFLDKRRPPEHMRHELDLGYRIDGQSVHIFTISPHWQKKEMIMESPIAKTTWVHSQKVWKIYWMRADLKWHSYEPTREVKTIEKFLEVVDKDQHCCFWG